MPNIRQPPNCAQGAGATKRDRTREQILVTALDLFAADGFEATSMGDIAAATGIVRQTVLNHFPRKSDLIAAWGDRRREGVADFPTDAELPVLDRIRRLFVRLAARNEAEVELTRALEPYLSSAVPVRTVPPLLVDLVSEGQRGGLLVTGVAARTVAEVLFAVYFDTLSRWLHGPARRRLEPLLLERVGLVLNGLAAQAGSEGAAEAGGSL